MLCFALPGYERWLPRWLASKSHGELEVGRFPNGELHVDLHSDVEGRECAVLGSLAPPDTRLATLLLAAHTLKKERAARVVAALPYLAYARQDKDEAGRSLAAAWVGSLLAASGVDEVVTIDVHSPHVAEQFPIPVTSLSPAEQMAGEITRIGFGDATVVSPDEGALDRCRAVAEAAGTGTPVTFLRKERLPAGARHVELVGEVTSRVVVVDDILDTGGTLVSCCSELQRRGATDIVVMVTHGLFTGSRWRALWSLGVGRIYVTDTVPEGAANLPAGVRVLPVAGMLDDVLATSVAE